jgi:putative ABC transport system permease protein
VLTIFLGGIAAISLLVGGIGIMNIMLVSVTERTREIGLRKALGARKRDILIQFLTESSLLSLIGGLIGILLGWTIAVIVGQIAAANNADIIPSIGLDVILLATLFSTAVGLFFGLYPANRAASLEPVEALRYESHQNGQGNDFRHFVRVHSLHRRNQALFKQVSPGLDDEEQFVVGCDFPLPDIE